MMNSDGKWSLTPAYDMTFILSPEGNGAEITHCMSLMGKLENITKADLIDFGKRQSIKNPSKIVETILEAKNKFDQTAQKNGINPFIKQLIKTRLDEIEEKESITAKTTFEINGIKVKDMCFEMTKSGNIHIWATIKGNTTKFIVTSKKPLYNEIINKGFNEMDINTRKTIFKEYVIPLIINKPWFK